VRLCEFEEREAGEQVEVFTVDLEDRPSLGSFGPASRTGLGRGYIEAGGDVGNDW